MAINEITPGLKHINIITTCALIHTIVLGCHNVNISGRGGFCSGGCSSSGIGDGSHCKIDQYQFDFRLNRSISPKYTKKWQLME